MALNLRGDVPEDYLGMILAAIKEGFAPFKSPPFVIDTEYDLDYHMLHTRLVFKFYTENFISKIPRNEVLDDPWAALDKVAMDLFHKLRYRPTLERPDNIILGEN